MSRKTTSRRILLIPQDFSAHFPRRRKRPVPTSSILNPEQATMQLEFHQLDRRWEHLRVREPHRQRRLLASLADSGQQTPIVVVAAAGQPGRYLVIDGHKRVAALKQLASNATGSSGGSAGPPLHQRGRTLGQPTLSRWRSDPPAVGTNLTIEGQ